MAGTPLITHSRTLPVRRKGPAAGAGRRACVFLSLAPQHGGIQVDIVWRAGEFTHVGFGQWDSGPQAQVKQDVDVEQQPDGLGGPQCTPTNNKKNRRTRSADPEGQRANMECGGAYKDGHGDQIS